MKAITCSQCGALITEITPDSKLVTCNYCKAKIPVIIEKILELSKREAAEAEKYRQKWKRNEEQNISEYRERQANEVKNHNRWMIIQIIILLTILILPFLLYYLFNG